MAQANSSVISANTNNTVTENKSLVNDEAAMPTGIRIFSSPVKDMLQIHANSDVLCTSLQIFDVSGKELQNVIVDSRLNQMYVNVQKLPSGLYLMKVNKEHDFSMLKFVKE